MRALAIFAVVLACTGCRSRALEQPQPKATPPERSAYAPPSAEVAGYDWPPPAAHAVPPGTNAAPEAPEVPPGGPACET